MIKDLVRLILNVIRNVSSMFINTNKVKQDFEVLATKKLLPVQVDGYEKAFKMKEKEIADFLESTIKYLKKYINKGDNILDVGCGTGRYLSKLNKEVSAQFFGIDISESTIKNYTMNACPFAELYIGDMCFKNNQIHGVVFNLIYSVTILQYIPIFKVKSFLKNCFQLIQANGFFYIQFPFSNNYRSMMFDFGYVKYKPEFIESQVKNIGFDVIDTGINKKVGAYLLCQKK